MENVIPVLIVGAGPTGLTMAMQLQRYGIPFRIIDKQIKPVVTSNALVAQACTLEIWNDIGILPLALSRGELIKGFNLFSGKKQLIHLDFDLLDCKYHFLLGIAQHETEKMLLEHLQSKNILVEMEVELLDLMEQNDKSILAKLNHKDGSVEQINAQWLIACDGGHSLVREKLNAPFLGKELKQHFVLADIEMQSDLSRQEGYVFTSDEGILLIIQYNEKYSRIIAEVSQNPALCTAKSLTYSEVKMLVEERCPFKLTIKEPIWTSGFWIHERRVSNFQHNKIFFAGDAAHIHSPAGGQGMNTGIQDAYNLAWKLAFVIQGKAAQDILSSYQLERYKVVSGVLRNTSAMTNIMTLHPFILRAIRNTILSWVTKFKIVRKKISNKLAQLDIHYSENILVKDCMPKQSGPKSGTRMLDVKLHDDDYLADKICGTQFVLLMFSGGNVREHAHNFFLLKQTIKQKSTAEFKSIWINTKNEFGSWDEMKIFDADLRVHQRYQVTKPCVYLIRPDKYVGFRGEIQHIAQLIQYLEGLH